MKSKEFGRIATQNAKNVILQKIREEERKVLFDEYYSKEKDIVTGIVQRYVGKNVSINLGKVDAILTENEQVKGEVFQPTVRIKVYILEGKSTSKGPRVLVSRTHPELVKRLFESEVAEVKDGTVEIKAIAREAGSRTKIAVWSNDPDVDPVGACVGMNGARVNAIVNELRGEKIDIIFVIVFIIFVLVLIIKEMIRVIKTAEDEIILDTTGRKNGRGAYICPESECLQKAIKCKGLERSFKMPIPKDVYEMLTKEMEEFETR